MPNNSEKGSKFRNKNMMMRKKNKICVEFYKSEDRLKIYIFQKVILFKVQKNM